MSDYADQTVAVLAVQGAFAEHETRLSELGARCIELRQAAGTSRRRVYRSREAA